MLDWALTAGPGSWSRVSATRPGCCRGPQRRGQAVPPDRQPHDALRAVDAGADGLIVEGAESGGLRSDTSLHIFTFLQQMRARVDVPLVAGGGMVDGYGMAGAFALGAEGIMMGTRFISAAESPCTPT